MKYSYDLVERAKQISIATGQQIHNSCCKLCNSNMNVEYVDLVIHKIPSRIMQHKCSCGNVIITDTCQYFNNMIFRFVENAND